MNGKPTGILVVLAGAGAGIAAFTVPVPMLELLLASGGVSEWIPAAAPPLGMTARLLIAGSAALLGAGAVAVLGARSSRTDENFEKRGRSMASAFSRLTAFARRGHMETASTDAETPLPHQRRADAHPDAPARAPIVASRDFGRTSAEEIIAPIAVVEGEEAIAAEEILTDAEGLDMPRAPEPLPWEAIKAEMERIGATMRSGVIREEARNATDAVERLPTISELAERLERGIARQRAASEQNPAPLDTVALRAIAEQVGVPSDIPASVTGRDVSAPTQDSDLQAALATLRGITAKAG